VTRLKLAGVRHVLTMNDAGTELRDVDIVVEDGWIAGIGGHDDSVAQVIDASHFLALPGFVNTHHHLYQTLTRGFPESEGRGLFEWLQMLYPIWAGLDADMIETSARAGLAELLLSGCTCSADHLYVFPPGSDDFVDREIEAASSLGIRFHATRGSMDLGRSAGGLPPDEVVQDRRIILRDSERLIATYHDPHPGAMTRVALAPCSPFSVSRELMMEAAGLARDEHVRLHTHLAETQDEERYSLDTYKLRPVELLDSLGWIADDVWLAHCVHLSETDIDVMGRAGTSVAHCPTSNMLLASGLAPISGLRATGVNVGLGVDGSASNDGNDMRAEVKQALLTARTRDGVTAMSVRDALRLATRGGAACLGRADLGSLEVGKVADIVLFDLDTLHVAGGLQDPAGIVALGTTKPDTVLVHGHIVVQNGTLQTADEVQIAARQREESQRLFNLAGAVSRR